MQRERNMDSLIKRAKKHDQPAFCILMEGQADAMYRIAKAILRNDEDAADAMQDTVLTCWEKIGDLKRNEYFKTWMTRILINHCNAIYRQKQRFSPEESILECSWQEEGYGSAEWREFFRCLDEKYRLVAVLYYMEGFSTKEIAKILELNENTVRGRLMTARAHMREALGVGTPVRAKRKRSEMEKKGEREDERRQTVRETTSEKTEGGWL